MTREEFQNLPLNVYIPVQFNDEVHRQFIGQAWRAADAPDYLHVAWDDG